MKGVLLVNLGSPKSTDPKDVKTYLDEFLMDERVMDIPRWLRTIVVRGIILNTRPKKSAANYERVWMKEGSPLIVYSERFQRKVDELTSVPIAIAMRYGEPSIKTGLQELVDQGIDDILVIPMFPQFANATIGTALAKAEALQKEFFPQVKFTVVPPYYNHPDYIKVLAESIGEQLKDVDYDHLLFSYHGLPERHIRKSDVTDGHCKMDGQCCKTESPAHQFCYRHQCLETTRLVAEYLQLNPEKYSTSFQSRLGSDQWLKPYTDETVKTMAKAGKTKLAIASPAFVADCIETIDELGREAKEDFEAAGGKEFTLISCLNDRWDWVSVVSRWVDEWAKH